MSNTPCIQNEFSGFFLTTAYDILGDGSFSRHLKAGKTTLGEEWAVELSKKHSLTAGVVRELVSSVKSKWEPGESPLTDIIHGTINSLSPPNLPQVESAHCAITGSICKQGLDVSALVPELRLTKYGSPVCVDRKYN